MHYRTGCICEINITISNWKIKIVSEEALCIWSFFSLLLSIMKGAEYESYSALYGAFSVNVPGLLNCSKFYFTNMHNHVLMVWKTSLELNKFQGFQLFFSLNKYLRSLESTVVVLTKAWLMVQLESESLQSEGCTSEGRSDDILKNSKQICLLNA